MDGHGEISQQAIASQHCDKSEATTTQCLSHTQWSRYFNFICILTFDLYFQHSLHVIALNFHFPHVTFHQCKDIYVHPYVLLVDSNRPKKLFPLAWAVPIGHFHFPKFTFTFCISLSLALSIFSCPLTALQVPLSLPPYYTLLKNTTIEHSVRLVTLETCYQSDEET